jgi:8-oxo-dGTP diphosphatase
LFSGEPEATAWSILSSTTLYQVILENTKQVDRGPSSVRVVCCAREDFAMPETITFGSRQEGVHYTERPAAYAVVIGENGTVAVVKGEPSGLFWLPGGGSLPTETAEETIEREVREELACNIRLLRRIGEAKQYFYASTDNRHYEMVAVFFLAEFPDEPSGPGEHDLYWLPLAEAERAFFHESHAWAVCQA